MISVRDLPLSEVAEAELRRTEAAEKADLEASVESSTSTSSMLNLFSVSYVEVRKGHIYELMDSPCCLVSPCAPRGPSSRLRSRLSTQRGTLRAHALFGPHKAL